MGAQGFYHRALRKLFELLRFKETHCVKVDVREKMRENRRKLIATKASGHSSRNKDDAPATSPKEVRDNDGAGEGESDGDSDSDGNGDSDGDGDDHAAIDEAEQESEPFLSEVSVLCSKYTTRAFETSWGHVLCTLQVHRPSNHRKHHTTVKHRLMRAHR